MKNRHFPLFVDSAGHRATVFGGGAIAQRRIETLLKFEFAVTVVSPTVTEAIRAQSESGRICWIEAPYEARFLDGSFLVLACTDDRKVNRRIGEAARARGLFVSVCDRKEEGNFYFPAVAVNEEVTMGLVGSGEAHGVTRRAAATLREIIERKAY